MACDPFAKAQELEARAKNKRLDAWNKIKQSDNNLAQLMTQINLQMGKPAAVAVKIDGVVVLKSGEFEAARSLAVKMPEKRGYR